MSPADRKDLERRMRRDSGMGDVRRDPKKKHKKRPPAQALKTLDDLWREVVRMQWGGKCALAGVWLYYCNHVCEGPLEAHHFIHRRVMLLKHDPANGVLLCKRAHEQSGYGDIKKHIEDHMIGPSVMKYLYDRERTLLQDYLAKEGITRLEFRKRTAAHLKALLEQSR